MRWNWPFKSRNGTYRNGHHRNGHTGNGNHGNGHAFNGGTGDASPDFLCVGAQKAGTSWLYRQLEPHPDFWMPPVKELHYFDQLSWTKRGSRRRNRDERDLRFFESGSDPHSWPESGSEPNSELVLGSEPNSGLEASAHGAKLRRWIGQGPVVICLSGRGDKDVAEVAERTSHQQGNLESA